MIHRNSKTYGESYVERSRSLRMIKGLWRTDNLFEHKPRMIREDAFVYYGAKLRDVFKRIEL